MVSYTEKETTISSIPGYSTDFASRAEPSEQRAAAAQDASAEQRHLLSCSAAAISGGNTANYGALNTSRQHDEHGDEKSALDITNSEIDSSMYDSQSQMSESVRYREHVSQY